MHGRTILGRDAAADAAVRGGRGGRNCARGKKKLGVVCDLWELTRPGVRDPEHSETSVSLFLSPSFFSLACRPESVSLGREMRIRVIEDKLLRERLQLRERALRNINFAIFTSARRLARGVRKRVWAVKRCISVIKMRFREMLTHK